jgi:hypothetical protein
LQEHASNNPGLQSFLDKKSDEHVYSALYLIAGAFCIYAAFCHGEDFCTSPPPAGLQVRHSKNLSLSLSGSKVQMLSVAYLPHMPEFLVACIHRACELLVASYPGGRTREDGVGY